MNAPEAVARPARSGLLRQFSTTVIDQVVLSGANFLVGLLLIRQTSDMDYGLFVLVQSALTLLMSGQMAWLSSPLAVLAPGKAPALRRLMVGAVEISQRRFLRHASAAALIVPVAGYFLKIWTGLECLVIALGIAACWTALQREYLRSVLLIYGRPHSMLRADLVNVGVLLAGAMIAAYGPRPAVLWAVAALIVSALAGEATARHSLAQDPGFVAGDAAPLVERLEALVHDTLLAPEREHRHRQFEAAVAIGTVVHEVDAGRRAIVLAEAVR